MQASLSCVVMCSEDSQMLASLGAPNLPTTTADTTQASGQYHFSQQYGAVDNTDGPQIGHAQSYGTVS